MSNKCGVPDNIDEDTYVGFGSFGYNLVLIFISIFGIFINLFFVINYLKKIISIKNKSNLGISAMEKVLCMIAFVETWISICWLFNNLFIQNVKKMKMDGYCLFCKIIAHFEIFLYLFDWMILSTSLYQIKIILLNPQQILESGKRVVKYILISFCISLVSFVFSIPANFGGISPMLTCFINVKDLDNGFKQAFFWIFFSLPLFCFGFGGYQVYLIKSSIQYKKEKKNRELYTEYSYFVITYIIFSFILIMSYILSKVSELINGFQLVFTILSCSNPLIVGLIRMFRTGLIKNICKRKQVNIINEEENKLIDENENEDSGGRIFMLEKKILENLIIKYFTAISYALGKSKYMFDEGEEGQQTAETKEMEFDLNEHVDYKITKSEILKDLDLSINEDIKVLEESNIDIDLTEYNPSTFKKLRELEGFNEDKIISMFQPKKGTNQLMNSVNDTLYINSVNKLLMLKKIKREQLMFFQRNILPDLYNYFVNHPNSLICRVFGLYKIKIDQGQEEYMALMYNTNESLENVENLKLLQSTDEVRKMKINEAELKKNIIIDSKQTNNEFRNLTIDIGKRNIEGSIMFGSNLSDKTKTFKLNLSEYENEKLINIINQDSEFLRGKSIYGYNFLVFERNIMGKERVSLFKEEEKNEEKGALGPSSKVSAHIKKYIFNSNLPDTIYTICILGYYRNK